MSTENQYERVDKRSLYPNQAGVGGLRLILAKERRPIYMSIVAIVVISYSGWAALLFVMQRSMMFPGQNLATPAMVRGRVPEGVEQLWIPFSDGRAEAWFVPAHESGASPAVIFAHGNAELIGDWLAEARNLSELGLSVLLVEYPGYGRSEGKPSRSTIAEVFLAAHDWLTERPDIDEDRIVGLGRSLGGGAITDLARERPLRALILQSTFTSVAQLARRYLLPSLFVRDAFDNLELVGRFSGPVLLIHGKRDQIIPYSNSERLARAGADAEILSLDCGHNDCPPDWVEYLSGLREFLIRSDVLSADSRGAS